MKAVVIFVSLLTACSSHVINKRSLLGGRQAHGHGHRGHHQQHQQHQRQQQSAHQRRNSFGLRSGRDGGHHQDESANEIRAAPAGYLPAAADYDYAEDLAGYSSDQAGTKSDDVAGYANDNLSGYEDSADGQAGGRDQAQYAEDQYQYGDEQQEYEDQYEEASGAEPKTEGSDDNLSSNAEDGYFAPAEAAASEPGRSADEGYRGPAEASDSESGRTADEGYGAPALGSASNIDPSYTSPDAGRTAADGYGAPVGAGAESDYFAPGADEARTAEDEYGAPGEYAGSQNAFPFASVEGQSRQGSGARSPGTVAGSGTEMSKVCPGGSLDACVEVCPGITARVYGACVQGCSDRCPEL